MRVVVTGATGNVGTALVERLAADPSIGEIVGVARRAPTTAPARTRWVAADVAVDDLAPAMRNADAVVHLAWAIQPSHDSTRLWRTNVLGSQRVIDAARTAGVPAFVHASSIGVYSPGPKDRAVDESWPREGVATSFYGRHKAEVERRLDVAEEEGVRIVRMRPGLIFSRRAASGIRRLFLGGVVPRVLLSPRRIPVVPDIPGLRVQGLHSDDVAAAYHRALTTPVDGAFNVAAEPVLDAGVLADALDARRVAVPAAVARAAIDLSWRGRVQPTPPGWLDLGRGVPLMDCTRAATELGWAPSRTSTDALLEVLEGMADGAGTATPPLRPSRRGARITPG